MPETRALTSTCFDPSTWPTTSKVIGTLFGSTLTTCTCTGGGVDGAAAPTPPSLPHAPSKHASATSTGGYDTTADSERFMVSRGERCCLGKAPAFARAGACGLYTIVARPSRREAFAGYPAARPARRDPGAKNRAFQGSRGKLPCALRSESSAQGPQAFSCRTCCISKASQTPPGERAE